MSIFPSWVWGNLDLTQEPFAVVFGADLGAPENVSEALAGLLADGEDVVSERSSNRTLSFTVMVEGGDHEQLADFEALLHREAEKARNTLAVTPGDGFGATTVFDTFRASLKKVTSDAGERQFVRRYEVEMQALPYPRSARRDEPVALSPVVGKLVTGTVEAEGTARTTADLTLSIGHNGTSGPPAAGVVHTSSRPGGIIPVTAYAATPTTAASHTPSGLTAEASPSAPAVFEVPVSVFSGPDSSEGHALYVFGSGLHSSASWNVTVQPFAASAGLTPFPVQSGSLRSTNGVLGIFSLPGAVVGAGGWVRVALAPSSGTATVLGVFAVNVEHGALTIAVARSRVWVQGGALPPHLPRVLTSTGDDISVAQGVTPSAQGRHDLVPGTNYVSAVSNASVGGPGSMVVSYEPRWHTHARSPQP